MSARVGADVTPPSDPAACGSLQTRIINRREGVCDWEMVCVGVCVRACVLECVRECSETSGWVQVSDPLQQLYL